MARPSVLVLTAMTGALLISGCAIGNATPGRSAGTRHPAGARATATHTPRQAPWRPAIGKLGTYRVRQYAFSLSYPVNDDPEPRQLRVFVRYPALPMAAASAIATGQGLLPLVVFAPGYRQCAASYGTLLNQWASAGYAVVAVRFPRTNCQTPSPDEADLVNQPADMSNAISRVLAASDRPGNRLFGLIDPAKIAIAGHSDGGDTVAAMAANTCCLDPRVSAVVVLAGAEWPPMPGSYFTRHTVPMLFVQGTADTWNPEAASLQLYQADTRGRRYYLDLPGAGHFTPYEGGKPPEPVVARVTTDFLDRYLADQVKALRAMRRAGQVPGVAMLVSGGRQL